MVLRRTVLTLVLAGLAMPAFAQSSKFPAVLEHVYGETIVDAPPERILTIGWMAQDAVLALGDVPVGMPLQTWGGNDEGVLPWVAEAVAARDAEMPELIDFADGPPLERIAALQPDLILAPYSDIDETEYAQLSAIAPTVAFAEAPWSGTWQDVTRTVGIALAKPQEAEDLIAGVDARMADIASEHPEFDGATFTFGYWEPGSNALGVYVSTDPRVQMLEGLGLVMSPGSAALPLDQGFFVNVSLELLEQVDADLLVTWHSDEAELEQFRSNPVVLLFGPVAEGRHVAMTDQSFAMATSAPSVLSIPWSIERLVPQISAALAER